MKNTLLLLFLLLTNLLSAQTVHNPSFKVRSGSISTITKIERSAENTKLYIHAVFRPHWWIKLDRTEYLEDVATHKKYPIRGAEGIELDQKTVIPTSGEMDFVLLFEPLPKETKEIHWLSPNDNEGSTFNISLEEARKKELNPLRAIRGNWLTTDTNNEWAFGFYDSLAIVNNRFYQYESIRQKGKNLLVTLKDEKENRVALRLTPQKEGNCFIQLEKGEKRLYSRKEKAISIQQTEADFTPFFRTDTVRLQGYFDGYDPRLGFDTGLIYLSNEATREDYPTVLTVHPNGRFEGQFVINHPIENYLYLNNGQIPFYVEPGQTLTIYINWEDIMARSRSRDQNYPIKQTRYMGPSATISQAMRLCNELFKVDYLEFQEDKKRLSPDQFKAKIQPKRQRWNQLADSLIQANQYSTKTVQLIRNKIELKIGSILFDFLQSRDYYAKEDTANQILKIQETEDYYHFLRDAPLNDEAIMADKGFSTFINRFEYMRVIKKEQRPDTVSATYADISLLTFLKEKGVKLTTAEEQVQQKHQLLAGKTVTEKVSKLLAESTILREASKREPNLLKEYVKLYSKKPSVARQRSQTSTDSLLTLNFSKEEQKRGKQMEQITGLPTSFAWEVATVRRLPNELKSIKTNTVARDYLNTQKEKINHPYLRAEAERIFQMHHSENVADSYELPASKAADIFRKIIQPHQGKVLFVDFWATSCAPCRAGIEAVAPLRKQYKDHPEFQFIYITSDEESPADTYHAYVDKNLKGEACYRVSGAEFNYLRELFQFNGIPHYQLIEKDGRVSKEGLGTYNLAPYLEKRFSIHK